MPYHLATPVNNLLLITYILYNIFFKNSNLQDTLNKLTIALPLGRIILNRDNIGLEPITHRFYLIFAVCVFNVSCLTPITY